MQYGFVIDHRKCIGCHACTVACKSENDVPVGDFRTWVKYTEIGSFPQVRRHFAVLRCNQCTSAPCVTICPVTALDKRPDGIVDLDRDVCIGCKACMQACPYDALYLNDDTGSAEKCHFCAHRVEQGLAPACEVVCPEQAIISGDLHDPQSPASRVLAEAGASAVRRPEQDTGPNVHYVGVDPVSLRPGTAADPEQYLWSERREPPPPWPDDHPVVPQARTVLDVGHRVMWGWKVDAYLVTKGIAAGAAMLAPFLAGLGAGGFAERWLPEILALAFLGLTNLLLVADLKRPARCFTLLTRPNTRSWLVKGAWVLMAFGIVTTAVLGVRLAGLDAAADALRWVNVGLGIATAGYTALLFAQCEGRDLWQQPWRMFPHLCLQALMLAAALLWLAAPGLPLSIVIAGAAAGHLAFALVERFGAHATDNARQAASLLPRIAVWRGSRFNAWQEGLELTSGSALVFLLLALIPALDLGQVAETLAAMQVPAAAFLALCMLAGAYLYEKAFVRAGQLPPLS